MLISTVAGVNVPRSRFLPVKKTQDLLLIMSNLYELDNGNLALSSKRNFATTPIVKLGSSFDKVRDCILLTPVTRVFFSVISFVL